MTKEDAISKLAQDQVDNLDMEGLTSWAQWAVEKELEKMDNDELIEEWEYRFEGEPNPFKG